MDVSGFFNYPTADTAQRPDYEFFSNGTEEEWGKLLACTEMQLFDAGDIVMRKGDEGSALYLLTEGTLEVVAPGHPGAPRLWEATTIFGERSFLDGLPRSVTLRALTAGEMLRLGRAAFDSLCAREPRLGQAILFEIGRTVSLRFRESESMRESTE